MRHVYRVAEVREAAQYGVDPTPAEVKVQAGKAWNRHKNGGIRHPIFDVKLGDWFLRLAEGGAWYVVPQDRFRREYVPGTIPDPGDLKVHAVPEPELRSPPRQTDRSADHQTEDGGVVSRYIDAAEAAQWESVVKSLREVDRLLSDAMVTLVTKLGQTDGRVVAAIKAAEAELAGLAYNCAPQPEWTGGDERYPKNTKIRAPHWAVSIKEPT